MILDIQNNEFGINLFIDEQPDLLAVQEYYLDEGGCFYLVINEDDEPVGILAIMNKGNGIGILKKFFVRKDYRSKKVGVELYNIVMEFCEDRQFHTLMLDTPSVSKSAQAFYEKNGFKRVTKDDLPVEYEYLERESYLYMKQW